MCVPFQKITGTSFIYQKNIVENMVFDSNLKDLRDRSSRLMLLFQELSNFERMIFWVRLMSSISILAFGLVLTAFSSKYPSKLYLGKLDTSSTDILTGLYDTLSTSVVDSKSTSVNNGVGLSTSEILLLTAYVNSQVQNLPNYFTTNLYGWCEVTSYLNSLTSPMNASTNSALATACKVVGSDYVFDYRDLLSDLGLGIVLSYAYGYENEDGTLNSDNSSGETYSEFLSNAATEKKNMINMIYVVVALEFIALLMGILFYSIKEKPLNSGKERLLRHFISLLKLVMLICSCIAVVQLSLLLFRLEGRINDELDSFGFMFTVGKGWFTCLVLFGAFNLISTMFWTGYEWCITRTETDEDTGFNQSMIGIDMITLQTMSSIGTEHGSEIQIIPPRIVVRDTAKK